MLLDVAPNTCGCEPGIIDRLNVFDWDVVEVVNMREK